MAAILTRQMRLARLVVLILWMALVAYWSNQSSLPIDQPGFAAVMHDTQHRVAHLLTYGLMGLLAWWAFEGVPRPWLVAILVTSAFGITDEFHQSFIAGRRAAVDDWLLDTASAALAIYVVSKLRATRLEPAIRALAPVTVCIAFAVGIGLAVRPILSSVLALLRTAGA